MDSIGKLNRIIFLLGLLFSLLACNSETHQKRKTAETKEEKIEVPDFNADSAYTYIEKQLEFGPRVPNTMAHQKCLEYLSHKCRSFGAEVIEQKANLKAYDGTILKATNIIAQFQAQWQNRILLMAHWDTRPYADQSAIDEDRNKPIPGANDGASGVGVLLEIARHLQNHPAKIGVDIIFFDAEDYGAPDDSEFAFELDTWCLGSQHWAKNPHKKNYYARYGILLDMVGARNAVFTQEGVSVFYAPELLNEIWTIAGNLGYSEYFSFEKTQQIVDDHRYINEIIGIPSIDIVQYDASTDSHFGRYWHTMDDDLEHIDRNTLKAVGQTLLHYLYNIR